MAGRLGRPYGLARGAGTPVVVEEKIIARAEIRKSGAAPGAPPGVAIDIGTLKKAKDVVARYGERGECISVESLVSESGITEEEANASLAAMSELEFGTKCCKNFFCSADSCKNMMDRIRRWRGIS